ncbi:hypothetical protein STRAU_4161 [Streptomyces aurantiacus JA 4570]|uniref:Secreted protein n=2 Tax=Streptomyces aurantiacus TaxID=47760 RepID=S3ZI09_9ACTN|nr:hypothetical protein STRAU_4161 [Streptomyces aurantiacus JA 4570]
MAAVSLAAGAAALTAPAAHASTDAPAQPGVSILKTVDDLRTVGLPAEYRKQLPPMASQLDGMNQLHQLHQLTDLVAPVTNAVPGIS